MPQSCSCLRASGWLKRQPSMSDPGVPAVPVVPTVPVGQPVMTSEPGVPDGAVHMPKMVEVHLISAYLPGHSHQVQASAHEQPDM